MSDLVHFGTHKGLFAARRAADGWSIEPIAFLGEPVTMLLDDPRDGTLYASLTLGHFGSKLRRSTDRGQTWEEVAVPVYPPGAEFGLGPFVPEGAPSTQAASLKEIWALETAGPDQAGCLWAGTIPGGLFRSEDRGSTWTLVDSLWNQDARMQWFGGGKEQPGIHSICVDPRDSRRVTVAVSCGGIWETTDNGATWNMVGQGLRADFVPPDRQYDPVIQDPHRLVQCRDEPEGMWVQHHNGIFRSDDGGKTFTELKDVRPGCFGFAVCVDPRDAKKAWFVPGVKDECRIPVDGRFVVNRTTDGGATFTALTEGLPQEKAYDLVYRHAMDIDASGERLAMGSTTGSAWVTEDGGDHWGCLSRHLPPIRCVRFSEGNQK